jgi:hypothetical protein
MNMDTNHEPGPRSRVSYDGWVLVPSSPGTPSAGDRLSSDSAIESDGRDPVPLNTLADSEEDASMRMGRRKTRPAESPFDVDTLLRQGTGFDLRIYVRSV